MRPSLTLLPLLIATAPFAVANNNTGPGSVVINEIRIDQPGLDDDEYFELAGTPGTSLAGMWYVSPTKPKPIMPLPFSQMSFIVLEDY